MATRLKLFLSLIMTIVGQLTTASELAAEVKEINENIVNGGLMCTMVDSATIGS